MKCTKLFMMAGTAKTRKYIPIHDLYERLTPATKALYLGATSHHNLMDSPKSNVGRISKKTPTCFHPWEKYP